MAEIEPNVFAKFSGAAETATKTRVLHHGTLLFDSDLQVLAKTLRPDPEKLRRKAIASVRSRVTNLRPLIGKARKEQDEAGLTGTCGYAAGREQGSMTTADFFEYLISFAEKEWGTTREPADREAILRSGFIERNASDNYNAGRRKDFSHKIKKYFPAGIVVLLWNESDGRFKDFTIEGDFFGETDAAILAVRFEGAPCSEEGIREALRGMDAGSFIHGVTNEEFAAFIRSELSGPGG